MAHDASVPVGAASSKSNKLGSGSTQAGPTAQQPQRDRDVADLVTHFTNIYISNSTVIFLSDDDPVLAKSESSTDPNQETADATPPPSPSPSADSHSSTESEFETVPPPPHDASQEWYRIYRGYRYCVPAPTAPPPYYMVTKGLRVGIFSGWEVAGALTAKVKGAIQRRISIVEQGYSLFEKALDDGNVEVLTAKTK